MPLFDLDHSGQRRGELPNKEVAFGGGLGGSLTVPDRAVMQSTEQLRPSVAGGEPRVNVPDRIGPQTSTTRRHVAGRIST